MVVLFFLLGGLLTLADLGRTPPLPNHAMKAFRSHSRAQPVAGDLCRSLPAYLADAEPWTESPAEIQRARSSRGRPAGTPARGRGDYPARRAAQSGAISAGVRRQKRLSLEFLPRGDRTSGAGRGDDQHSAAELESDPALHALAEEILGNAQGHFDLLEELKDGKPGEGRMMKDEG